MILIRSISILFATFLLLSCQEKTNKKTVDTSKAPMVKVIDTDFSKGSLNFEQELSLEDMSKFHGHLCDGLIVGYLGLNEALKKLYPNGVVDRTNTRIVSKSSPCLTDVAIYLTGGRYQYNGFYVDNEIEGFYQVQRVDNKKAYQVDLKQDVKPKAIDSLGNLAIQQQLKPCEIKSLKELEDDFSVYLLENQHQDLFLIKEIQDFKWHPRSKNNYLKTDVINKDLGTCK
ncbi:MAG: formylmethanofuran dehydrogenase subunit E family protein [Flavobacteriaceae bacterium]|nr:formylmethanofuran dehydrogenase subunit E family protein [Flavobacteriaceae bacterium]